MHLPTRAEVCASTSKKINTADIQSIKAVIGLDGFVDNIIDVVDTRQSATSYERLATLAAFGSRISACAGQSSNCELVIKVQKLGGNGPIMANALAAAGLGVTYIGNLGYPTVHPVFDEMARRAEIISIADPGMTDALEFLDGKLMMGKLQTLSDVSWENLVSRIGKDRLIAKYAEADLIAMNNWTMLPHMTSIWQHMLAEVMPQLPKKSRHVFIDLADPEKRPRADLRTALNPLSQFQKYVDVTLGLNLREAVQIVEALDLQKPANPEASIELMATAIRQLLQINTVVIHPRGGAAAATAEKSASFAGPFVTQPKISTGAGDHFNAGFMFGQMIGLDLIEALCTGTATSGYYVRNAASPTAAQLSGFIKDLPAPQN